MRTHLSRTRAVGVVVPLHNEQDLADRALTSLEGALESLRKWNVEIGVAVVLDACTDGSARVVNDWIEGLGDRQMGVLALSLVTDARNVGVARGLGCTALLDCWRNLNVGQIWLATTDCDSRVPKEWLVTQVEEHEEGADLWSGRIEVTDWFSYRPITKQRWQVEYDAEVNPIHGTSLGFNASLYVDVGGFPPLATSEDRELYRRLVAAGARARHDSSLRVLTSSRRNARAPRGFAHALELIDSSRDSSEMTFPPLAGHLT